MKTSNHRKSINLLKENQGSFVSCDLLLKNHASRHALSNSISYYRQEYIIDTRHDNKGMASAYMLVGKRTFKRQVKHIPKYIMFIRSVKRFIKNLFNL